jgi:hypothetical protein
VIRETYRLILKFRYTLIDGRSKDEKRVYLNDAPDYGGGVLHQDRKKIQIADRAPGW